MDTGIKEEEAVFTVHKPEVAYNLINRLNGDDTR